MLGQSHLYRYEDLIQIFPELGNTYLGVILPETFNQNPVLDSKKYFELKEKNTYYNNRTGDRRGIHLGPYLDQVSLDFDPNSPEYLWDLSFMHPLEYVEKFDVKVGDHFDKGHFNNIDIQYIRELNDFTRRIFRVWFYALYMRRTAFGNSLKPEHLLTPVTKDEFNYIVKRLHEMEVRKQTKIEELIYNLDSIRDYVIDIKTGSDIGHFLLSEVLFPAFTHEYKGTYGK